MILSCKHQSHFRQKFLLFLLFLSVPGFLLASNEEYGFLGSPIIQHYKVDRFQGGGTNWFVQQNDQGIIFLSNASGLFSFDGEHWRQHLDNMNIRQFVIDNDNIYIGAETDLGFLKPDKNGHLIYHSLIDKLPQEDRAFSAVNNVFLFEENIYFITPEQIMIYQKNGQFKIIKPEKKFSRSWLTKRKLFFNDANALKYIEHHTISEISLLKSEKIKSYGFVSELGENDSDGYIIGTFSQGIYLWKNQQLSRLITPDNPLSRKGFYNSLRINNKLFAVSTIRDGVYFFNHQAEVIYHINNQNGLKSNIAVNLFMDKQQGLWVPQEGQLSRVQLPFNLSIFSSEKYNMAKIASLVKYHGSLYLSAVNGVVSIDQKSQVQFLKNNVVTSVAKIIRVKNELLLGGAGQCQSFNPLTGKVDTLLTTAICSDVFIPTAHPDTLFMITEQGIVSMFYKNGTWSENKILLKNRHINTALLEDNQGNIWSATSEGKLIKIYWDNHWKAKLIPVSTESIQILSRNGIPLIATSTGLYHWDTIKDTLSDKVAWFHDYFGEDATPPSFLFQDSKNRLWISTPEHEGYLLFSGNTIKTWSSYPVAATAMQGLRQVYEDNNITWIALNSGLVRYESSPLDYEQTSDLLITEINNQQSGKTIRLNLFSDKLNPVASIKSDQGLILSFSLNNYLRGEENRYRFKLNEGHWSQWQKQSEVTLQNMSGGNYSFTLEARDFQGRLYKLSPFNFHIIPPWYASWWAYLSYIIILLASIWLVATKIAQFKTRKLREQQLQLEQQVAERTKTIEQQKDELKLLDEAKSRFFANVSHEFRTPLTLTIGPLQELIKQPQDLTEHARQQIAVALENSRQMLALVGQILDINRLEQGEMNIVVTPIDLLTTIEGILLRFQLLAEDKNINLELTQTNEKFDFYFDEDHLNKIITNLLSNAIKFSPENASVRLTICQSDKTDSIELKITDGGPGIPDDEKSQLFNRFFQGKNSSNSVQPGTGIGLAMVKELLDLHQGSIELDESYVTGCCFLVTFMKGKLHYKDNELLAEPHHKNQKTTFVTEQPQQLLNTKLETDATEIPINSTKWENRANVLIVDDNPDLREYIRTTITSVYNTLEAGNGVEALALISKTPPDFIISDIMMPEMDGYELTNALKSTTETAHIPLLLLTAKATKRDTVEGLQQGADDYLSKPFDSSELIARIDAHLHQKKNISNAIYQSFIATLPPAANDSRKGSFKQRFSALILENISRYDFDIAEMTDAMHMERSTLFRNVKKEFSSTPTQYLKSQRLTLALHMLRKNSGSISEIAYAVGFQSLNYFSRSFREQYQVAPTNFHKINNLP